MRSYETVYGEALYQRGGVSPFLLEYSMKTKEQKQQKLQHLAEFIGSENYYRYNPHLFPNVVLTDGVRFLAETAQCFWLLDTIALLQKHPAICNHPQVQQIQFWTLQVDENESATLLCEQNTDEVVYQEKLEWTDFPLRIQRLWVCLEKKLVVIMLPTEY